MKSEFSITELDILVDVVGPHTRAHLMAPAIITIADGLPARYVHITRPSYTIRIPTCVLPNNLTLSLRSSVTDLTTPLLSQLLIRPTLTLTSTHLSSSPTPPPLSLSPPPQPLPAPPIPPPHRHVHLPEALPPAPATGAQSEAVSEATPRLSHPVHHLHSSSVSSPPVVAAAPGRAGLGG